MRKRARPKHSSSAAIVPATRGVHGGLLQALSPADLANIDAAVREILQRIGMADAPPTVTDILGKHGCKVGDDGRLRFPPRLIDAALAGLNRNFTLPGQDAAHDMHLVGARVYTGSGGAAPFVVDLQTGNYRAATLRDLSDAARLCDAMPHIHFFSRSLVAGDLPDARELDLNTAYASLAGTSKPVFSSASSPENVAEIARLCYAVAGGEDAFRARPFLSFNVNHVTPPLRFAGDACEVMAAAVRAGFAVHANAFGQLGASSPVTVAGTLAQNAAEALAGMIFAWCVCRDAKITFGMRPMLTDLRTGSLSGGGGEQAMLMACAVQVARFYDLPNTCIAGATDGKIADAQSGFEKSLSVSLAAQAGANVITQAAGSLASLSACAMESYVIDNEMLGAVLRALQRPEISAETLAVDAIAEVVASGGPGHFLGQAETLARMQSDFLYPQIADRRGFAEWADDGRLDLREVARVKAREILRTHFPRHISPEADAKLRAEFVLV